MVTCCKKDVKKYEYNAKSGRAGGSGTGNGPVMSKGEQHTVIWRRWGSGSTGGKDGVGVGIKDIGRIEAWKRFNQFICLKH